MSSLTKGELVLKRLQDARMKLQEARAKKYPHLLPNEVKSNTTPQRGVK